MSIEDEVRRLINSLKLNADKQDQSSDKDPCEKCESESDLIIRVMNYRLFASIQLANATVTLDIEKVMLKLL